MAVSGDGPGPMRVILVGMMGSGKSSVGRALAKRTGWPFLDNDLLVERATGRTARQLLEAEGEEGLRRAEGAALREAISQPPPIIVATAAGTILDAEHRHELANAGFVVWLYASPDVLAARSVSGMHRPWLDGDITEWFSQKAAERDRLYASIDDLEIDTAETDPEEAADRILAAIGER